MHLTQNKGNNMEATQTLQRQEPLHWYSGCLDLQRHQHDVTTPPASLSDTDSKISELATVIEDGNE